MGETVLLKGTAAAKAVRERVAADVATLRGRGITARLAAVLASDDPAAVNYVQTKQKSAAALGIDLALSNLGAAGQDRLESTLAALAADPQVHGILLEFPLATGLDANRALEIIPAHKDVDGLTAANISLAASGREEGAILAATAQACVELAGAHTPLAGKRVGLVGRGRTVGRPLLAMLVNRHATVTVCHTKTPDLRAALAPCEIV